MSSIVKHYDIDTRYKSRNEYIHYDDRKATDECQLEVYLHALGLMTKHKFKKVADFGCGSAYKLMTYMSQYETVGYELDINLPFLKEKYPEREWRVSKFDNTPQIETDVLICADVIEHLVDPDELISFFKAQSFKFLLVSTPARELVYRQDSPGFMGPPANTAHQREWTFKEFRRYIERSFRVLDHRVTNLGQATQLVTLTHL